ncbi:hypothetical protein [Agromyces humi]|uniref:hypothetical protein n=1 Tax=Agromyces humi TaxID=1766800 RepID=UPI0013583C72|nr:hypothetical protein [Agromyces humi]
MTKPTLDNLTARLSEAERVRDELRDHLSAALDEIYALRRGAAFEAAGLKATLDMKSFPKSRRTVTEQQTDRLIKSARGNAQLAYAGEYSIHLDAATEAAGAENHLTMSMWVSDRGRR